VLKHAEKDADKLKAVDTVLKHLGFTDLQSGLYGWGIGATTAKGVEAEQNKQLNPSIDAMLAEFS